MTSYEISERVKYMQENGYSNKDIESWVLANDKNGYYRYNNETLKALWEKNGFTQHEIAMMLNQLNEGPRKSSGYDHDYDDGDYDNGYTHSQQSYADRSDYARELYESGRIDRIQMAEMRMGA